MTLGKVSLHKHAVMVAQENAVVYEFTVVHRRALMIYRLASINRRVSLTVAQEYAVVDTYYVIQVENAKISTQTFKMRADNTGEFDKGQANLFIGR